MAKKKTTKSAAEWLAEWTGQRVETATRHLPTSQKGGGCGDPSVLANNSSCNTQSKRATAKPPVDCNDCDAVKVAIAVHRRDHLIKGPGRPGWLAKRAAIQGTGIIPPAVPTSAPSAVPPAPPTANASDPAAAYAKLMAMMSPKPPVPMAGEGGTGLPTSTPGGEMGAGVRNTPSTNPIGMMSGLGVDPGGSSVMGNAAFGTQNKVARSVKLAYGPYDQRTQDYYAIRRARNLRSRSDQPMTFGQAMGRSGRGMFPDRQLGQGRAPGRGGPQNEPIVMVGSHRLTPDELVQWQGLDRAGQKQMAAAIKARPAGYTPPVKAVAAPAAAPPRAPSGPPSNAALADQMWSRYAELKQQGHSEATAYEIAKQEQSAARQGGTPQFAQRHPPAASAASAYGTQMAQQAPQSQAPPHDMTAPQGMTAQQAAVWEQRKGDPQWAAKARAWLQRPQQPQQPQQPQVAQQAPQAPPQGMTAQQAQVWEQRKGDPQWEARARAWLQRPQQSTQQPVAAQSPQPTSQVAGFNPNVPAQPPSARTVGGSGAKPPAAPSVATTPSPAAFGKRSALAPPAPSAPSASSAPSAPSAPPPQSPPQAPAQTTAMSRAAINRQLAATPKPAPRRGSSTLRLASNPAMVGD